MPRLKMRGPMHALAPVFLHGMHREYFIFTFVFIELLKNMQNPEPFWLWR
jgi:hypothetical protein